MSKAFRRGFCSWSSDITHIRGLEQNTHAHTRTHATFKAPHLHCGIKSNHVRGSILICLAFSEEKPRQQMSHRPREAAWHRGISFRMAMQIR